VPVTRVLIAIDPGREKCGVAALDYSGRALWLEIADTQALWDRFAFLRMKFPGADRVAVGAGTGRERVLSCLAHSALKELPASVVNERDTTRHARARYFEAHPPRGFMRLLPRGLRLPPRPVDDFAAAIIGARFLKELAEKQHE